MDNLHQQQLVTEPEVVEAVARIMRRASATRYPRSKDTDKRLAAIEDGLRKALQEVFAGKLTADELERFERTMTSFLTKLED